MDVDTLLVGKWSDMAFPKNVETFAKTKPVSYL